MTTGKTIQIFLPDSNPRGIRIAEITSRTVKVLQIPRAELEKGIWIHVLLDVVAITAVEDWVMDSGQ